MEPTRVNAADLLKPPPRRDVRSMTASLAGLRAGDHVSVTLATEKYGVVHVEGHAYWSTGKNFLVGGLFIESGLKPDKSLLSIGVGTVPAASSADGPVAANFGDYEAMRELADRVGHGDVVRATFDRKPYGQFTITGIAVQTADRAVTALGSYFISAMTRLEVLGTAAEFHLPTPKTLVWDVAG